MTSLPGPEDLPVYPASWYLFGSTRQLRRGPVSREMLGRRIVVYRTASGRLAALDARCAHLGADLGEGTVLGEDIQCAFHNWQYGPDGHCTHVPALTAIPALARQRAYPVVERHGFVFVFNGPEPLFPLPFFADADPDDYVPARPLRFHADCPWYMVNGNSFDVQHFRAGHDREMIGNPVIDCPHPFARRIRLTFAVVGHSRFDWLLRRFVGDRVEVTMTNWGGSIVVVTGQFRRTTSRLITFIDPLGPERCVQNVLVFARRLRFRPIALLFQPLGLALRRLFTRGFMAEEFQTLGGIRYNPAGLVESDRPMVDFLRWIAQLPKALQGEPDNATSRFAHHRESQHVQGAT